jgi:flagellar hook assembly protein FlgD
MDLPELTEVRITVFDILGQKVVDLVNGRKDIGYHKIMWNGRNNSGIDAASGMYIFRMAAKGMESGNTYNKVVKAILVK